MPTRFWITGLTYLAFIIALCGFLESLEAYTAYDQQITRDWSDDLWIERTALFGITSAIGIGITIRLALLYNSKMRLEIDILILNAWVVILMALRLAGTAGFLN